MRAEKSYIFIFEKCKTRYLYVIIVHNQESLNKLIKNTLVHKLPNNNYFSSHF